MVIEAFCYHETLFTSLDSPDVKASLLIFHFCDDDDDDEQSFMGKAALVTGVFCSAGNLLGENGALKQHFSSISFRYVVDISCSSCCRLRHSTFLALLSHREHIFSVSPAFTQENDPVCPLQLPFHTIKLL